MSVELFCFLYLMNRGGKVRRAGVAVPTANENKFEFFKVKIRKGTWIC